MSRDILEVIEISKTFKKRKVLDNLSFSVQEGDVFGFLGKNGAGKTTTIRIILNLINADNGRIVINGFDTKKQFKKAISNIGAIVETPKFYNYLSGYDNLKMVSDLMGSSKKDIEEVISLVGLKNRAKDKVKTYSLGMNQRLGIAQALLHNPKIVILDEPTNGLDPQGMKEIRELISQLATEKNITFLISTHLLNEVEQICNKVAIIDNGKLVTSGEVSKLLQGEFETIHVHTDEKEEVMNLLSGVEFIKNIKKSDDGLKLDIEKGSSSKINTMIVSNNFNVKYIVPERNTLEEFFIEKTKGGEQIV